MLPAVPPFLSEEGEPGMVPVFIILPFSELAEAELRAKTRGFFLLFQRFFLFGVKALSRPFPLFLLEG